jgi:hypothetical protein
MRISGFELSRRNLSNLKSNNSKLKNGNLMCQPKIKMNHEKEKDFYRVPRTKKQMVDS